MKAITLVAKLSATAVLLLFSTGACSRSDSLQRGLGHGHDPLATSVAESKHHLRRSPQAAAQGNDEGYKPYSWDYGYGYAPEKKPETSSAEPSEGTTTTLSSEGEDSESGTGTVSSLAASQFSASVSEISGSVSVTESPSGAFSASTDVSDRSIGSGFEFTSRSPDESYSSVASDIPSSVSFESESSRASIEDNYSTESLSDREDSETFSEAATSSEFQSAADETSEATGSSTTRPPFTNVTSQLSATGSTEQTDVSSVPDPTESGDLGEQTVAASRPSNMTNWITHFDNTTESALPKDSGTVVVSPTEWTRLSASLTDVSPVPTETSDAATQTASETSPFTEANLTSTKTGALSSPEETTEEPEFTVGPISPGNLTVHPTVFPESWESTVKVTGSDGAPSETVMILTASLPPFPTRNMTTSAVKPGTGVVDASFGLTESPYPHNTTESAGPPLSIGPQGDNTTSPTSPVLTASLPPAASTKSAANDTGTGVPGPWSTASSRTIAPFPNITTSDATGIPGTAPSSLSGATTGSRSPTLPQVSLPPTGTTTPPFPFPNGTTLDVTGTVASVPPSVSLPLPIDTITTSSVPGNEGPPPLPPLTFPNTTLTFTPETDLPTLPLPPLPSTEATPFPFPNATRPGTISGTGTAATTPPTPATPLPSLNETTSDIVPITTLPEVGTRTDTLVPWPNITTTGGIPEPGNFTILPEPPSSVTSPPISPATEAPFPTGNATLPGNVTSLRPDDTGTLSEVSESLEPTYDVTTGDGATTTRNVTAVSPTALPTSPPFPTADATSTGAVKTIVPTDSPSITGTRTVSLPDVTITLNGTVTVTGTGGTPSIAIPPDESAPYLNTTTVRITEDTSAPQASLTETNLMFPNTTSLETSDGISASEMASTATSAPGEDATRAPTTVTLTPVASVTITASPVTSPCITITVTHGNVTQKITKTVTDHSASGLITSNDVQPTPEEENTWVSGGLEESTTPCDSTSELTEEPSSTTCTLTPIWSNTTSLVTFESRLSEEPSYTTAGPTEAMNTTWSQPINSTALSVPIPDPTTLLTSTVRDQEPKPWDDGGPARPTSTAGEDEPLPSSNDYPWGGEGPLHRHQNVTMLGSGVSSIVENRGSWWARGKQALRAIVGRALNG